MHKICLALTKRREFDPAVLLYLTDFCHLVEHPDQDAEAVWINPDWTLPVGSGDQWLRSVRWVLTNTTDTGHVHDFCQERHVQLISLQGMDLSGVWSTADHTDILIRLALRARTRQDRPGLTIDGARVCLLVEDAYNPGRVARQLMVLLCNQGASVRLADLVNHEWMGAADVVSIHLPAKSCYRGIVDRRMLAKMRRGVTLVNTSRDTVVNAYPLGGDVYEALATGAIRRYATDFPPEWHHPNLIVTEHVAGYTVEGLAATQWMIARRFRELLQQSVGATSEIG